MSTAAIVGATRDILAAALTAVGETSFVVAQGVPKTVNTDVVIYLYHFGYGDEPKARGWVRRTHGIPIHLMILTTGDDAASEARLLSLSDTIANAFYGNHALNGTAATAELVQSAARTGAGISPLAQREPYVLYQNGEYRHRWWSLEAVEDVFLTFA